MSEKPDEFDEFWQERRAYVEVEAARRERIAALEAESKAIKLLVAEQAEDDGLWFVARTAPEAYLQRALRQLHSVIEGEENWLAELIALAKGKSDE